MLMQDNKCTTAALHTLILYIIEYLSKCLFMYLLSVPKILLNDATLRVQTLHEGVKIRIRSLSTVEKFSQVIYKVIA